MIRFIYNLLWPIGLLVFLPGYLVKMFRRGGYRENFGQRLGMFHVDLRKKLASTSPLWLHAVSVGEVAIALKLAPEIRALMPDWPCVLTTTTTTGFAFAKANAPAWIQVIYAPLDFWPIMRHAFTVIRPRQIVLIEAEVWPNLVAEANRRRIPLALVNARLSPRSEGRFRRFRFFVSPMFRMLDLICVQNVEDIERWTALGVGPEHLRHVGSIKYDPENVHVDLAIPREVLRAAKIDNHRPVLLGGSTHHGEEEILAKIFCEIRTQFPDLFLILAPRHVERAAEVERVLAQFGLRVHRRSAPLIDLDHLDCLLLDSTGELRHWYSAATIVFIGKTLLARGGQNPAEAIMAGKPVLFGSHMENFSAFARELIEHGGALQVSSAAELQNAIVDLLRDGTGRDALVRNAREVLEQHHGAAARTAKLIVDLA
ncbi:MAG: glycosyltransferase N-terminal domain-containing protein [Spartobacteria bacterium]